MSDDARRKQEEEQEEETVHDRRLIKNLNDIDSFLAEAQKEKDSGQTETDATVVDTTAAEPAATAPPQEAETTAEFSAEELGEGMPDLDAQGVMELSLGMFIQQAWIHLGLVVNPATNLVAKDLSQARLAIDAVAALIEVYKPHLDDQALKELQGMLANLRMNYIQVQ